MHQVGAEAVSTLLIFASTFALVLFLGLQQLNVAGNHRVLAMLTSAGISGANLVVLKSIPGPTDFLDLLAYITGGPLGILVSMLIHPHLVRVFKGGRHG